MSAVRQAIARLSHAVDNLDGSVEHVEQALTGKQRDMFSMPAPKPERVANSNVVNADLVARKLDDAIERIEQALKEGQG